MKRNKIKVKKCRSGKFVDVNCATLGGELAKAALFGYKKGAFTGAEANHDGYTIRFRGKC